MKYNILTESELFTPEQIERIEKMKEATYVCETCVKDRSGQWANTPVAVFYQPDESKVPEGGSQWFGLYYRPEYPDPNAPMRLFICNAISALEPFDGIVANNGDVIYSRYRHDYRRSPDGSVMIDGGRDYTRTSTCPNGMVRLAILKDKVQVI